MKMTLLAGLYFFKQDCSSSWVANWKLCVLAQSPF